MNTASTLARAGRGRAFHRICTSSSPAPSTSSRLGGVTSTKWSFEGLTASAHVKSGVCEGENLAGCNLPGLQSYATDPERRVALDSLDDRFKPVFGADVYETWAAMAIIMAVLLVIIVLLQKRKDVI
jgi:hypothetical protein